MFFKTVLTFFTVALFLPITTALTYAGYSSTVSCSGSNFFCNDGGAVCCGPMPTGYGYSAQFNSLPAGTQGQGYTNACSAFLFHVFGPGTKCWNGGGARARYLNWFHSAGRRSIPAARAENQTCASISGFSYTDEKGAEMVIKVASEKEAEDIAGLYTKKDFAKLSEFARY
ncbi:hypothetical protein ONZ45_g13548 [Pleurotus djamor]|nr:hypothetical protein ONZ45_g13548 [Pleurotus djamor]